MILRGTEFGPVLCASGARGFFGEGYPHHKYLKMLGLDFANSTLVTKTTTLEAREGNMPLGTDGITPMEFRPRCILPNFHYGNIALSWKMFRLGIMLNSVALSGPGAEPLFETGRWQAWPDPFLISFMAVGKTPEQRIAEATGFAKLFKLYLPGFHAPVGLQINKTCPNVGLNPDCLVDEVIPELRIFSELGIPLMYKFNALTDPRTVARICESPDCDAVCVSNTILWGKASELIDWNGLFGSDVSPLAKFGGGGLSGRPLLPLVVGWLCGARDIGIRKPINAGGGILSPDDVNTLYAAGASSVFLGTVGNLRPWRVPGIIKRAHQLFGKGDAQ